MLATKVAQQQHQAQIIQQFSRQAISFTELPGHYDAIQMLQDLAELKTSDDVLDVACGPGLVACEFARIARQVTGLDVTEKMLHQAALRQRQLSLSNLSWQQGDAYALPYADNRFDLVVTRYSFHHLLQPAVALQEMLRVCKPGGRVLIADVCIASDKARAFNHMERLRDPSHVAALNPLEWLELLADSGLQNIKTSNYQVPMELEQQLNASFPFPGDQEKIRQLFALSMQDDSLGLAVHSHQGEVHFAYPIVIFAGSKTE